MPLIETAVDEYNNKPHSALFGLSPKEVLFGKIPDKEMFKNEIFTARKLRKIENQNANCQTCIEI